MPEPERRKRAAIVSGCIRLEAMSRIMRIKQESHGRVSEKRSRRLLSPHGKGATPPFFQRIDEQRFPCLLDCFNTGMNSSVVGILDFPPALDFIQCGIFSLLRG